MCLLCSLCYCRLRAARVLLVGVSGLGAEVAKNIVLSGIKSLTLLDSAKVSVLAAGAGLTYMNNSQVSFLSPFVTNLKN